MGATMSTKNKPPGATEEKPAGRDAPDLINTRIAMAMNKVAARVRAKAKSIRDYGWCPSATEEDSRRYEALDESKELVRSALNDVADALEEEAEELAR